MVTKSGNNTQKKRRSQYDGLVKVSAIQEMTRVPAAQRQQDSHERQLRQPRNDIAPGDDRQGCSRVPARNSDS